MTSPFLYLSACSIKNRVLARLRRLRQPRYLIGAIVGIAYLYTVFFPRTRGRRAASVGSFGIPPGTLAALRTAAAFVLWLVVVVRWIVPVSTQPLTLSGAERDLLLTAPVSRRRLTRYKLLRSQLGVLVSSALMLVVAWRSVDSATSFLVGTFLIFTTVRLHLLGVALARKSALSARGGGRDWAALGALAVITVSSLGALSALSLAGLAYLRTRDAAAALALGGRIASQPPVSIALLPFTLLLQPVFATSTRDLLVRVWPAVLLAVLNYAWVLAAQDRAVSFEAATEQQTVEGRRAPARPVYRRAPFVLAPSGRFEWAIVWKNLILLGRYVRVTTLLRVAALLIIFAAFFGVTGSTQVAAKAVPLTIALACGLTLLGPYTFRNDLRQDMAQLSLLKTWPISGERLLWGEVLSPSMVTSALVYICVAITGVLSLAVPARNVGWIARLSLGGSALILFPTLILAQVVVQNAAVVLFPGWVAIGPSRPRGVEAMGQQMLMFAGSVLLLVLGILPGGLVGGAIGFVGYRLVGWPAVLPASIVVAGLLLAETVVAIHLLGALIDRTDPTAVEPGG